MMLISEGPMNHGASLQQSDLRGMSLADSHTFCPGVYRGAGVQASHVVTLAVDSFPHSIQSSGPAPKVVLD